MAKFCEPGYKTHKHHKTKGYLSYLLNSWEIIPRGHTEEQELTAV